jgi:hypothetical protein
MAECTACVAVTSPGAGSVDIGYLACVPASYAVGGIGVSRFSESFVVPVTSWPAADKHGFRRHHWILPRIKTRWERDIVLTAGRGTTSIFTKERRLDNKIIAARITAQPKGIFDKMPEVFVTLDDGTETFLFSYYPDELSFEPNEFVGLTEHEARHLKFKKDKEYLQS